MFQDSKYKENNKRERMLQVMTKQILWIPDNMSYHIIVETINETQDGPEMKMIEWKWKKIMIPSAHVCAEIVLVWIQDSWNERNIPSSFVLVIFVKFSCMNTKKNDLLAMIKKKIKNQ